MRSTLIAMGTILLVLLAGCREKQESFESLDSEIVLTDVDLLTEQERTVVELPFQTSLSTDGVSASRRTYCSGNYGIRAIVFESKVAFSFNPVQAYILQQ